MAFALSVVEISFFMEESVGDRAKILDIDDNGEILHVEIRQEDGEMAVGIYELLGWTKAPQKVKAKAELELWVPPKVTQKIH